MRSVKRVLLAFQRFELVRQRRELAALGERELRGRRPAAARGAGRGRLRGRSGRPLARGRLARGHALPPGALGHPVAVAAGVLVPAAHVTVAARLRHQRLRHHVVEKRPVVAHEQQRAGVGLQRGFEEVERFDVEIVRRLVQHEEVRGPREEPGEQQAIALAARQRPDGRVGPLRRKQEVPEIGQHVLAPARGLHPLRAGADRFGERALAVELLPQLVEVGDRELRAEPARSPSPAASRRE